MKGKEDEGLDFICLDRFMRGSGKESGGINGRECQSFLFLYFVSFNIGRIERERKSF